MVNAPIKLFQRQKLLLTLLHSFGGSLKAVDLQKYLFLYTSIHEKNKSYEFVPYKYGCFSFQSYADKRKFTDRNIIKEKDAWEFEDNLDLDFNSLVSFSMLDKINSFTKKYKKLKGDELVHFVYKNYPYYAINSEIAPRIMNNEEIEAIDSNKPKNNEYCFFTIGYEGQSFEAYLNDLIKNNVKILCDVRKNPISRKYGFSKKTLSTTLERLGIKYLHIPELGIESASRKTLKIEDDYKNLFKEYERTTLSENQESVMKLQALLEKYGRVAITCFEADHNMCHRNCVANALIKLPNWQYDVIHI